MHSGAANRGDASTARRLDPGPPPPRGPPPPNPLPTVSTTTAMWWALAWITDSMSTAMATWPFQKTEVVFAGAGLRAGRPGPPPSPEDRWSPGLAMPQASNAVLGKPRTIDAEARISTPDIRGVEKELGHACGVGREFGGRAKGGGKERDGDSCPVSILAPIFALGGDEYRRVVRKRQVLALRLHVGFRETVGSTRTATLWVGSVGRSVSVWASR